MSQRSGGRGIPLHTKILLGLGLGAAAGVVANVTLGADPRLLWFIENRSVRSSCACCSWS
jgi:hypothetical protein